LRRIEGELPTILVGVGVVAIAFWGEYRVSNDHDGDSRYTLSASIIYSVVITILASIYKFIAVLLANWENHKYKEAWENSLISKTFAFLFVNAYISLFTKGFAIRSFNEVAVLLITILAVKQIVVNFIEVVTPKIL
jgi:hypothetical protein